jgi:CheY-like chemotaxis protein
MPEMDGFEATVEIRKMQEDAKCPRDEVQIVSTSGLQTMIETMKGQKAGMD